MKRKLTPKQIAADREALRALVQLGTYQSLNPAYSLEALLQVEATLQAAEEATGRERLVFAQGRQSFGQALQIERDTAWMLHEMMHVAKTQVVAQYGDDSYAVKAIGWVRKSERKR